MNQQLLNALEVRNVLEGLSAQGRPRGQIPSFPTCPIIRAAFADLIGAVSTRVAELDPTLALSDDDRTMLISRVAAWVVATRRASLDGIHEAVCIVPYLAHATVQAPKWMHRMGVAGVQAHAQLNQVTKPRAVARNAPAPVCWRGPASQLLELHTRAHLAEQGALARNCLGSCYDGPMRGEGAVIPPRLRYLRLIESGEYRLFALRDRHGQSLATIEYHVKREYITTLEITYGAAATRAGLLPDIFAAFNAMGVGLQLISQGHRPTLNRCLSEVSFPVLGESPSPVGSRVVLGSYVRPELLQRLMGHEEVLVDISFLPPGRHHELPAVVGCHLHSQGRHWPSQVEVALGSVHFSRLQSGDFRRLAFCGHTVSMPTLDDGYFPNLRAVRGDLLFDRLARAAFPRLETVGGKMTMGQVWNAAYPVVRIHQGEAIPPHIHREVTALLARDRL